MSDFLTFQLPDEFVAQYKDKPVNWGFSIGAENSGSELNYYDKYSSLKSDGSKEKWWETTRRCVEGSLSIYVDYCRDNDIDIDREWLTKLSEEMYERMHSMQWCPPGRGMQFSGTFLVNGLGRSDSLFNCSFVGTGFIGETQDYDKPFCQAMIELFSGIGVGFDLVGAGKAPVIGCDESIGFIVEDTREGWVEGTRALLRYYFYGEPKPIFDYTQIRPKGAPIKTFGGVCPGYRPLEKAHHELVEMLDPYIGSYLDSRGICDIMAILGKSVVSGGQRRSAELALGSPDDEDFVNLKNWNLPENERRMGPDGFGNMANHSLDVKTGAELSSNIVERMIHNGEPGVCYMDVARTRGRMIDPPLEVIDEVDGYNPCAESKLNGGGRIDPETGEVTGAEKCNLADIVPINHNSIEDFLGATKCAYFYAKCVTLLPTSWSDVNLTIDANRRLGISVNGITQFLETHSLGDSLWNWMDKGYKYMKEDLDPWFSDHLDIPRSISLTAEKPNGNSSIVSGCTPGVHFPVESGFYVRRIQYSVNSPLVPVLLEAGYECEPYIMNPEQTLVFSFPMTGIEMRSEKDVSLREKMEIAAKVQYYWADQAVSATFTFKKEESDQVGPLIEEFGGHKLKVLSFLPLDDNVYDQQPIERVPREVWDTMRAKVKPLDFDRLYASGEAPEAELYCTTDSCILN